MYLSSLQLSLRAVTLRSSAAPGHFLHTGWERNEGEGKVWSDVCRDERIASFGAGLGWQLIMVHNLRFLQRLTKWCPLMGV